jgi:hypothetical protein
MMCMVCFIFVTTPALAERPGDTVYVGVLKLPVHQRADGYSPVVGVLSFGDTVMVLEFIDYYPLPKSTQPPAWRGKREREIAEMVERDSPLDRKKIVRLRKELAEGKQVPTWIRIEGGFVHYQGTVPLYKWSGQNEPEAQKLVNEWAVTRGKRGFSENEQNTSDVVAMKGLAGKAVAAAPDYGKLDAYLADAECYDFLRAYEKFRRQGGLGEYKKQ